MKTIQIIIIFIIFLSQTVMSQIHKELVQYKDGDATLEGYIAYDESLVNTRPGVLVVHEYFGLNDYAKMRCDMLAKLGYFAFAADIYGKGVLAKTPEEAGKLAGIYRSDRNLMRSRINSALTEMKKQKLVDADKIAVIGYCFGGTTAMELGLSGADIKGIVSFHGGLEFPNSEDFKNIKGKVLICHGSDDPYATLEAVMKVQMQLKEAGVNYQINIYSGAVHSFSNPASGSDPSKGVAYNEQADKRSWEAMKDFFAEIFK
jgi:dienelactone hydrolase